MNDIRALSRLIDRLEEFLDEYKTSMEADDVSIIDEAITVIDQIKNQLEEERPGDENDYDSEGIL